MNRLPHLSGLTQRVWSRARSIRDRHTKPLTLDGDVYERDAEYIVRFDAPGVAETDVQIRYVDGTVMARMERYRPTRDGYELVAAGRRTGFEARAPLPPEATVEPDDAAATLRANGILEITVPKAPESEADDPAESISET